MEGSAHYEGRAIDVFVRPVSAGQQAPRLGDRAVPRRPGRPAATSSTVIFDDRIWTAGGRSDDGWRDYDPPERSRATAPILEHRDHVHVDVSRT